MRTIIKKIKQKPELSSISDEVIKEALAPYEKKHNISIKNLKEKEQKIIIKEIRAKLRKLAGQYQKSTKKRIAFLKQDKIKELLKTHSSTAERINFYPKLKALLRKLKINSILDLACGLNPLALSNKKTTYYAADINESELSIIGQYFIKNKIKGKTFSLDLRHTEKISKLPKTDITFLFKVLDIIEEKGHKIAGEIISKIKSEYILISFPTKKLSGKPMQNQRRHWLERLLKAKGIKFKTIKSENEVFYLVENL